ncbi:MAG: sigma 54-interacting transcriptional regulator [Candidatus Limnocylindrales bacterium]
MARSPAPAPEPATPDALPATIGELRESGWHSRSVKEELRANLLAKIAAGEKTFPGIVGYEETVIPAVENALLAGQDIVFLGERGQAKTRLARLLVGLLDPWLPVVRGGQLNDDPFAPISAAGRAVVAEGGDVTPLDWIPRDRRHVEKLATPDITIADLIGEVDPIRLAEGRYLSDELTLHYGLIPRANRGIFAINELPDLAERIQVGLLNILEERDVQIRGFTIRLPLDLFVVASANPEDYTSRGRIITPLKDRLGSQIRTHYPRSLEHEVEIIRQEKHTFPVREGEPRVLVPDFMEELVADLTHLARRSADISQRSGVSVRVSVTNMEVLEAAALKRAVRLGELVEAPRISDLGAVLASTTGKIEVETAGEDTPEERIVERLVTKAVFATFNRHTSVERLEPVLNAFEDGLVVETGELAPARDYVRAMRDVPGLRDAVVALGAFDAADGAEEPALVASAVELLLEGLHLHRRLTKDRGHGGVSYRR